MHCPTLRFMGRGSDFLFQLTVEEADGLNRSQSVIGSLRSQIVTSSSGRGGRRYAPYAFTEHGAIMAANVLNSPRDAQMSVFFHVKEDPVPYRTKRKVTC